MKGKLGRYLDLDEHLALGVTIAWYPGFTHHVTWAALWDFMTAFESGGVKAWGRPSRQTLGHADLRLGDAVARVLERQIAAGDGRSRGIRQVTARAPVRSRCG